MRAAAALPQSPQVSRWPFPLSCLITTAGWLLREEALSSSSGKDYKLTIGLFLFPTAGHCAAKRRQLAAALPLALLKTLCQLAYSSFPLLATYCAAKQRRQHMFNVIIYILLLSTGYVGDRLHMQHALRTSLIIWRINARACSVVVLLTLHTYIFPLMVTAPRSGANIADLLV